ncbi:preprotein translocase subunit SecE [Modestobacter sp. Leaf380]|nr:preprotein translocase subunit SecE [Modestobacter sp. Leaf380]
MTDEQIDAETPGVDDAAELEAAEDEIAAEAAQDEDKVVATPARRRRGAITADDADDEDTDDATGAAPRVRRRDRPGGRPASEARTTRPAGGKNTGSKAADGEGTRSRAAAEKARAEELRDKRSIGRFLREVVAELRKVIWPGRKELITYTTVVIVFVAFMVALVAGLDILFAQGVLAVFG